MTEVKKKKGDVFTKLEKHMMDQEKILEADPDDLDSHFCNQALWFKRAGEHHNKAEKILKDQKKILEDLISVKYLEIKSSTAKTTEAFIAHSINVDEEVQRQKNIVLAAEYQASEYKSLVRSWEHKRDMLIQLGSNFRAELSSGISIRNDEDNVPDANNKYAPGLA